MALGYLALVLHAHLPFVRHPESDYVLEEEWLFEAITETYIPLLQTFEDLKQDGIEFKVTMSMTPPLVSMLRDSFLQQRYDRHLGRLQELAAKELQNNANNGHLQYLAQHYINQFARVRQTWETYQCDLVSAFKGFQDSNNLEIITSAATHGYLPLMKMYPEAVRAQIEIACKHYEENFGSQPRGIWLPECAYYDGLERFMADAGYAISSWMDMAFYMQVRVPVMAPMPPFIPKPEWEHLGATMNHRSRSGPRKWVIRVIPCIASFIKI